jgi:hypothetical protein
MLLLLALLLNPLQMLLWSFQCSCWQALLQ